MSLLSLHAHTHMHTHACTHTHTHAHTHACTHTHAHTCTCTHANTHTHTRGEMMMTHRVVWADLEWPMHSMDRQLWVQGSVSSSSYKACMLLFSFCLVLSYFVNYIRCTQLVLTFSKCYQQSLGWLDQCGAIYLRYNVILAWNCVHKMSVSVLSGKYTHEKCIQYHYIMQLYLIAMR